MGRHFLGDADDDIATADVGYLEKGLGEPLPLARQAEQLGRLNRRAIDGLLVAEKPFDRTAQFRGDDDEPRRRNAVDAFLVFLHLLKRQIERLGERLLTYTGGDAGDANALADSDVDGFRVFDAHDFNSSVSL
jgi:hypothetical protein